jgi:multidrug transporter EmrE-like cation transporter
MSTMIVAVISIVLSVAAQFSLKAGMSGLQYKGTQEPFSSWVLLSILTNRFVILGFFLYGLGAIVWLAVLSKWDVSKAYPLVGLGFLLTVAVGFLMGEQVTVTRAIGVGLISAGVFVVSLT